MTRQLNLSISYLKYSVLAIVLTLCLTSKGQKRINVETSVGGQVKLTPYISIPKINSGYTVWLPDTGSINGLVVFFHSRRDTLTDSIIDYATAKQLAVLYATTNNRVEFLFSTAKMLEFEKYIHEVLSRYNIPDSNTLFCGMSLEGTRAMRMAKFSFSDKSKYKITPRAMAMCDAPLDMVRFYKIMVKAKKLKFTPITANEGRWVSGYLELSLGGSPKDTLSAYLRYSPYSYSADENTYLHDFKNISIRTYTEPDVNWWINTRRKDYYSMNSLDMAGLVNELKILGSKKAELIVTQNKGYYDNGERHPHNWNIVDEIELINWFLGLMSNK